MVPELLVHPGGEGRGHSGAKKQRKEETGRRKRQTDRERD